MANLTKMLRGQIAMAISTQMAQIDHFASISHIPSTPYRIFIRKTCLENVIQCKNFKVVNFSTE